MKTLKQIQEENRKFIIMANNPSAETHNEALEMELGLGCLVQTNEFAFPTRLCYKTKPFNDEELWKEEGGYWVRIFNENAKPNLSEETVNCRKIIGKPLTLDRVLLSICEIYSKIEHSLLVNIIYIYDCYGKNKIKWDLTKKTLENQSEEVQREFNKLIIDEI